MRKTNRLLAAAMALVLVFALAACGDSFESAIVRAARELKDVESVHAGMTMNIGLDVAFGGESASMPISVSMDMDTAGSLTSGEMSVDVLGVPVAVTYIVERDGDDFDLYLSMDGGSTWESQLGISADELGQTGYSLDYDAGDMVSFYLEFASNFGDPVEETAGGVECRRYDGSFPGAQLGEAMALSGGGSFAELPDGETPPDAPISIWLAVDDGLPRRITLDLTDAIGQYMTGLMEQEGLDTSAVNVTASEVSITVELSEYNSAVPLTPPAA